MNSKNELTSGPTYVPESTTIEAIPKTLYVPSGYSTISGGASVLLLASGAEPTTLRTALSAFPDLTTVDYINASITTPSLATLSAYDAVIMMSETLIANSGALGDVLADYVDAGGRVVQSVASFATGGGWELSGRFVTYDYGPFVHGGPEFMPHTLGSFDAAHPVMAGVTVLTDGYPVAVSLKPIATWIAAWDNGTPLVAVMGEYVVGINDYVFENGNLTGDDVLLYHNAIVYLLSASDFELENLPSFPHAIVPGGAMQFNVIFAPEDIESDSDAVVIASNDMDEPEIIIDLTGNGIEDLLQDVDGDGMDDRWEVLYFGSTNLSGGAETDDWDGDGFRDIFEFLAGTDPTNSNSLLEITSFDAVAGDSEFVVKWQSVEDKSYRLMSKESLGEESWTTNKSSITATPPENTESVIPNSDSGFLSVELE